MCVYVYMCIGVLMLRISLLCICMHTCIWSYIHESSGSCLLLWGPIVLQHSIWKYCLLHIAVIYEQTSQTGRSPLIVVTGTVFLFVWKGMTMRDLA